MTHRQAHIYVLVPSTASGLNQFRRLRSTIMRSTGSTCQELDGSGLLGVRKTVILWVNESVVQGTMGQKRAQSSNWTDDEEESGIVKR